MCMYVHICVGMHVSLIPLRVMDYIFLLLRVSIIFHDARIMGAPVFPVAWVACWFKLMMR